MYEDDGRLTEQMCCVSEEGDKHCILCVRIRTYKDLTQSELGSTPYMIYDPNYNEFTITVPTFNYLTIKDIAKALFYIVRENVWMVFNISLDGKDLGEHLTYKYAKYKLDNDTIQRRK
jgi:hypothetical protein